MVGDIITAVNDTPVTETTTLEQLTGSFASGQEVTLQLYRNGAASTLTLLWNK